MDFIKTNFTQFAYANSVKFASLLNALTLDGVEGTWVAGVDSDNSLIEAVVKTDGDTFCLRFNKNSKDEFFELWKLKGTMYEKISMNQRWLIEIYETYR